jgi:hypothetical protein
MGKQAGLEREFCLCSEVDEAVKVISNRAPGRSGVAIADRSMLLIQRRVFEVTGILAQSFCDK